MRDLLISAMVVVGCLATLHRPYIGVLLWSWLSYMNPHRLAYGFAYNMPFAFITALTLLLALPFAANKQRPPLNAISVLWLLWLGWMGLTTLAAVFPDDASMQFQRVLKIQLMVLITLLLITDLQKLNQLLWVIVLSIGFFAIKGGIFTLLTGGGDRVWGPAESFIEGNNELAVATLMVIPLMAYLYTLSRQRWLKAGLLVAMPLSAVAALGTQSRGALIAFAAVLLYGWCNSKNKLLTGVAMLLLTVAVLGFMPDSWHQRMNTIQNYEEDSSAMGRINAWQYAINVANHQLMGVGFDAWHPLTFALDAPNPQDVHAAHSIYFSVLADHGWIGLLLFLLLFGLSWKTLQGLAGTLRQQPEQQTLHVLVQALKVSFIAYFVGGAFLSLSYFDLPWQLISVVLIVQRLQTRPQPQAEAAPSPAFGRFATVPRHER